MDAGTICGIDPVGVAATDDVEALVALAPDALVHYGPTAAKADVNIAQMGTFLRAGIDVCSTAMTPWVWPHMTQNPPSWVDPITEACAAGDSSCFTTGIDPGFANDLFPMTLMGLCSEVRQVRALEILDYINYEGDYEVEMGIGMPPEYTPMLEHTEILAMSWGGTVPMMAHAVGVELEGITSTWEKWVTPTAITTAKGTIEPGQVAAIRFTINGMVDGRAPDLPRARQPGRSGRRPRLAAGQRERRLPGGRSTAPPRSPRRPRSGSPTARAGTPPPPVASPPGSVPSTPCPT